MEPKFAIAEGADGLSVDLDISHQENLFVVLLDSLGATAQLFRRFLAAAQVAEIGSEPKLIILRNVLAPEHQDEMLSPRVLDCLDRTFG